MPKNNKSDFFEYVLNHFMFELFILCLYNSIVYNLLPGLSYSTSRLIFFISTIGFAIISMLICRKRQRNRMTIAISVLFPIGVYTCFSYYMYLRTMVIIVTYATIFLSAAYTGYAFLRKVKNPDLFFVYKKRFFASARMFFEIATVMLSIVTFTAFFTMALGDGFSSAAYDKSPVETFDSDGFIRENIDTLDNISTERWKSISLKERIQTLQLIADAEAGFLGLPHELTVQLCSADYSTLGYYNDKTHSISININRFTSDDPMPVVNTVIHESFHAYQKRTVDIYNNLPNSDKKLALFKPASEYQQEFINYKGGFDDFDSYYTQKCESDARNYAARETQYYYKKILEYNDAAKNT